MSELKTRVKLLYRKYNQWKKYETDSFILLRGEICFCEIPKDSVVEGIDTSIDRILLKAGDGSTPFAELKWLSALPATKVGNNAKYKITAMGNDQWKLQVSIDEGPWQDIEGSANINIAEAMSRITQLETSVASLTTRMGAAEQAINDIIPLSSEEIHEVIDK